MYFTYDNVEQKDSWLFPRATEGYSSAAHSGNKKTYHFMFNAEILMPFNMLNEHCRESVMGPTPFTKMQLVHELNFISSSFRAKISQDP